MFKRFTLTALLGLAVLPAARAEPVSAAERIPVDIRRTTFVVRDIDKSLALYRDALGLKLIYDTPIGGGVDKDGKEWYQITLGGADGSNVSGPALPGKVVGPSFLAAEVPDVIAAVLDTYRSLRQSTGQRSESFIETLRRTGLDPFKLAANGARHAVQPAVETAESV